MVGIVGEVSEFVRIVAVVVEFLGAVFVDDQSPVATPNGVIAEIRGGDCGTVPARRRVLELWDERKPFEVVVLRQAAQLDKRRVDVEQAGGLPAGFTRMKARPCNEQRYARGFLPQGALGPMLFFTEMKTVVTPKDDQRVVGVRTVLQGVQHNADAVVDKRHRGQVGVGQAALFAGTHHLGVGRRDGVIVDAQKILRQIVEIALRIVRQRDLVRLVLGKPLGRHEERDVRTEEADRHKERLVKLILERLGCVVGELDIGHLGVLFRVGAPIPGTAPARGSAHRPLRPWTTLPP